MYFEWFSGVSLFLLVSAEILGFSFLISQHKNQIIKKLSILISLSILNLIFFQISHLPLSIKSNTYLHLTILFLGVFFFFFKRPHHPYLISPLFWKKNFFWLLPVILWFSIKATDCLVPHFQNEELFRIALQNKNLILFQDPISQSIDPSFSRPYFLEYLFYHVQSLGHFFGPTFLKVHFRGLVAVQLTFLFWGSFFCIWSLGRILGKSFFYTICWLIVIFLPQRWWLYFAISSLAQICFVVFYNPIFNYKKKEHFVLKKIDHLAPKYTFPLGLVLLFISNPHAHILWQNLKFSLTPLHHFLESRVEEFQITEWINQNLSDNHKLVLGDMERESRFFLRPISVDLRSNPTLLENLSHAEFPSEKAAVLCDFGYTHIYISDRSAPNEGLSGLSTWLMTQKQTEPLQDSEIPLFSLPCLNRQPE